jgi:hypothetical protein
MWINEIEANLPNGLHDSLVESIYIDYLNETIRINLQIEISDYSVTGPSQHRSGVLVVYGLKFISIEEPEINEKVVRSNLRISSSGKIKEYEDGELKGYYFFIVSWNGYIKICGESAELQLL